jgi:predicted anti-sigma-YlaC factor YlaD
MNVHPDSFNNPAMESLHPTPDQPDRFELLSAYLDGEVTPDQRRQVEQWLANDPKVQNMHRRLLMLREGFRTMPAPATALPVEQTIDKVFAKIDRRSRFQVLTGGGAMAAAAAAMVAAVVGIGQINQSTPPMVATNSSTNNVRVDEPIDAAEPEVILTSLGLDMGTPLYNTEKKANSIQVQQLDKNVGTKGEAIDGQVQ